jgi:hypothetical protein
MATDTAVIKVDPTDVQAIYFDLGEEGGHLAKKTSFCRSTHPDS